MWIALIARSTKNLRVHVYDSSRLQAEFNGSTLLLPTQKLEERLTLSCSVVSALICTIAEKAQKEYEAISKRYTLHSDKIFYFACSTWLAFTWHLLRIRLWPALPFLAVSSSITKALLTTSVIAIVISAFCTPLSSGVIYGQESHQIDSIKDRLM